MGAVQGGRGEGCCLGWQPTRVLRVMECGSLRTKRSSRCSTTQPLHSIRSVGANAVLVLRFGGPSVCLRTTPASAKAGKQAMCPVGMHPLCGHATPQEASRGGTLGPLQIRLE